VRIWFVYIDTWAAATRVLSRGRKRDNPGNEVGFRHVGAPARCEIVSNCEEICALTIKVLKKFIFLMDISQESDPKSQDEIPVRPSLGKNFECYVRERYLKKISVVDVYRAAIPSEKFSWECLPPIEVSNLPFYLVFTQISSLRPWKVWIRTARWFLVSLRQFKGKKSQENCCGQGEKFTGN